MPRKYRPPATRRRKKRATAIPYESESGPAEAAALGSDAGSEEEAAPLVAVGVAEAPPEPEGRPQRAARTAGERHVARDYGYVRGEVLRIGAIATFIVVSLVITAILRN